MSEEHWDAVVVGAGIAGAVSSWLLAKQGARVLLVERSSWPRAKVCGGCLSYAGVQLLDDLGLEDVLDEIGAPVTDRLSLHARGRAMVIPLRPGRAFSRQAFDEAMVQRAQAVGVVFRPQTRAKLGRNEEAFRGVLLAGVSGSETVKARVVLACDGLHGRLCAGEGARSVWVDPRAWVGLGAIVERGDGLVEPGVISMRCCEQGYLGAVEVERQQVDLAAAVDPGLIRSRRSAERAMVSLLEGDEASAAGFDKVLSGATIRGTPPMTWVPHRGGTRRVLAVGDASGYVEPFTGEGMSWALLSAARAADAAWRVLREGWREGEVRQWERAHQRGIRGRQWVCGLLRRLVHRPRLLGSLLDWANLAPRPAEGLARWVHRPWRGVR